MRQYFSSVGLQTTTGLQSELSGDNQEYLRFKEKNELSGAIEGYVYKHKIVLLTRN